MRPQSFRRRHVWVDVHTETSTNLGGELEGHPEESSRFVYTFLRSQGRTVAAPEQREGRCMGEASGNDLKPETHQETGNT